jgi:hypothetical protein
MNDVTVLGRGINDFVTIALRLSNKKSDERVGRPKIVRKCVTSFMDNPKEN